MHKRHSPVNVPGGKSRLPSPIPLPLYEGGDAVLGGDGEGLHIRGEPGT